MIFLFLAGVVHKVDYNENINFYGTSKYSWTGQHMEILDETRIAVSAHMSKVGGANTVGQVKILDYDLNELLTLENPEFPHSDQFGYSMILSNLNIEGESKSCLLIGAPVSTYGFHTNGGSVHIFDSETFEYFGKIQSDRAFSRLGSVLPE